MSDRDAASAQAHPAPPTDADAALPCPKCEYDLRGQTTLRCPECGANFNSWEDILTLGRRADVIHHHARKWRVHCAVLMGASVPLSFLLALLGTAIGLPEVLIPIAMAPFVTGSAIALVLCLKTLHGRIDRRFALSQRRRLTVSIFVLAFEGFPFVALMCKLGAWLLRRALAFGGQ